MSNVATLPRQPPAALRTPAALMADPIAHPPALTKAEVNRLALGAPLAGRQAPRFAQRHRRWINQDEGAVGGELTITASLRAPSLLRSKRRAVADSLARHQAGLLSGGPARKAPEKNETLTRGYRGFSHPALEGVDRLVGPAPQKQIAALRMVGW